MARFRAEPTRFYDGGSLDGSQPPQPGVKPKIVLERVLQPRTGGLRLPGERPRMKEMFRLERRIAYDARRREGGNLRVVVPAPFPTVPPSEEFLSDLTSVPLLFAWLVPRTGSHLPAALVHDGMVHNLDEPASYDAAEPISREEADRIFRDAMGDLGTALVRRWFMWAAVTLATVMVGVTRTPRPMKTSSEGAPSSARPSRHAFWDWYFRIVAVATLLAITVLGVVATLDFLDVRNVLWWMGEHGWVRELFCGAVMAVVVPAALSLLWLRLWKAGFIAGIALALLFHVTVILALLTFVFHSIEYVALAWRTRP